MPRWPKLTAKAARSFGFEVFWPAKKALKVYGPDAWAAQRHPRGHPPLHRGHQRAFDNPGGRRDPFPLTWPCAKSSISTPASARWFILRESQPPSRQPETAQRRHFFAKTSRDVYAGNRMGPKAAPRPWPSLSHLNQGPAKKLNKQIRTDSGIGIKTDQQDGQRAASAPGFGLRPASQAPLGHFGAQRQHHEVHRGQLSRLGLRPRQARTMPTP